MAEKSTYPAGQLPAEIAQLLEPDLPPLGPGRLGQACAGPPEQGDPSRWTRSAGAWSTDVAACCRAGLWLWNGFLEESDAIGHAVHTAECSWWHGIMHRREPDPAAYSFTRSR